MYAIYESCLRSIPLNEIQENKTSHERKVWGADSDCRAVVIYAYDIINRTIRQVISYVDSGPKATPSPTCTGTGSAPQRVSQLATDRTPDVEAALTYWQKLPRHTFPIL